MVTNINTLTLQLLQDTKTYTNESDEEEAIAKMKKVFESDEMWHGDLKFPDNESDARAHEMCNSNITAPLYCPRRWKSMKQWEDVSKLCNKF